MRRHRARLMASAVYQVRPSSWMLAPAPLGTLQDALLAALRGRR